MSRRRRGPKPAFRLAIERCEQRVALAADFGLEGGLLSVTPAYADDVTGPASVSYVVIGSGSFNVSTANFAQAVRLPVLLRSGALYLTYSRPLGFVTDQTTVIDLPASFGLTAANTVSGASAADGDFSVIVAPPAADSVTTSWRTPTTPTAGTNAPSNGFDPLLVSGLSLSGDAEATERTHRMFAATLPGLGRHEYPRVQPLLFEEPGRSDFRTVVHRHLQGVEGGSIDATAAMSVKADTRLRRPLHAGVTSTDLARERRAPGFGVGGGISLRPAELARAIVVAPARTSAVGLEQGARQSSEHRGNSLLEGALIGPEVVSFDESSEAEAAPTAGEPGGTIRRWSLSATAMAALVWAASWLQATKPVGCEVPSGRDPAEPRGRLSVRRLSRRSA